MNDVAILTIIVVSVATGVVVGCKWRQVRALALNFVALIVVSGVIGAVILGGFQALSGVLPAPLAPASRVASSGSVAWHLVPFGVSRWADRIEAAARECGIDPALLAAIVMKESSGNPTARGDAGEIGLVQLMPVTAAEMGVTDRSDPDQSLRGGACYLGKMIKRYDGSVEHGIAAYNAGPGNVDKGIIPNSTKQYGRVVMGNYKRWRSDGASDSGSSAIMLEWPVKGGWISQGAHGNHMAYDIAVVIGTPVRAAHDGHVKAVVRSRRGYGWHIVIDGAGGISSLYAHLSSIEVVEGQRVERGQLIAKTGNTGNSSGPHLHFEIMRDGKRQNPAKMIGRDYGAGE